MSGAERKEAGGTSPSDPLFEVVSSEEQNLVIQEAAYSLVDFLDGEEERLARVNRREKRYRERNGVERRMGDERGRGRTREREWLDISE